ncbi:MAG: recombinase family protein [Chloroflexi bacterium]|nr:recombinase family protein [Chloroflexota bacterium]
MNDKNPNQNKRIRFAIYTRYSSELQNDLSLEAQEDRCRRTIAERGGVVVNVYSDGAKTGWSLEREGFMNLRRAAERGRFDAVMFWKFDRLARDHDHAVMIKMLLRHEYGLKLYCVEGFSEDESDSPYTAMMEQMLAVFSAFYSKNLSSETKRGKYQRVAKGEFNGSIPPLGYHLVTLANRDEERQPGLHINLRQAAVVRRAFRMYATGEHSDLTIAQWMNRRRVIQQLRQDKQPIGKDTVRDILQNQIYTGRVPYAETLYAGTLGQGKKSNRHRKQWFEGKHQGFISDELFERCQEVRQHLTRLCNAPMTVRTYVLRDRVYCARCVATRPKGLVDVNYGKMRPAWDHRRDRGHYRCMARDRGYHRCEQGYAATDKVDEQVVRALVQVKIPEGFQERVEEAIRSRVEHAEALRRMAEIEEVVKRIDFSWEQGFLTPEDYIGKRSQLQKEIDSLRPVDYDDLVEAADLLGNFQSYWDACENVPKPEEARQQLLAKIVDRIFVYDDRVIAIALHGDFSIVIDNETAASDEVIEGLRAEMKKGASESDSTCTRNGSDGDRTRDLRLDRQILLLILSQPGRNFYRRSTTAEEFFCQIVAITPPSPGRHGRSAGYHTLFSHIIVMNLSCPFVSVPSK